MYLCVRVKRDLVGGMNECPLGYLDNVCNVWLRFSFGLEYDGFVVGEVYRPRMLQKGFHLEVAKDEVDARAPDGRRFIMVVRNAAQRISRCHVLHDPV